MNQSIYPIGRFSWNEKPSINILGPCYTSVIYATDFSSRIRQAYRAMDFPLCKLYERLICYVGPCKLRVSIVNASGPVNWRRRRDRNNASCCYMGRFDAADLLPSSTTQFRSPAHAQWRVGDTCCTVHVHWTCTVLSVCCCYFMLLYFT